MLTDTAIRKAKPATKPVRMFDASGLYLEVSPAGGKLWRWKYRINGKEKRLALGTYPDTGRCTRETRRGSQASGRWRRSGRAAQGRKGSGRASRREQL